MFTKIILHKWKQKGLF